MGRSISLWTMAVNEGPGILASGSSSRASWQDFPTCHRDNDDDGDGDDGDHGYKDEDDDGNIDNVDGDDDDN